MSGGDTPAVVSVYANTAEERVAASRVVLEQATSREDLAELMDALGLNGRPIRMAVKGQKPTTKGEQ